MTAHSPFSDRSRRAEVAGKWPSFGAGDDPEGERLQAYCNDMTRRDPRGLQWFVAGTAPKRYVDCRA